MLICARCVKLPRLRQIVERYAGVEGSGVMLVSKENEVLGRAHLPSDDEDEGAEEVPVSGSEPKKEEEAKRKMEDDAEGEPVSKKAKMDDDTSTALPSLAPNPSASSLSTASTSTTTNTAPRQPLSTLTSTASSSTAPSSSPTKICHAPPVLPPDESPLSKLEKQEGARANVFLEEGWMMRWCRCTQVRSLSSPSSPTLLITSLAV
jgi:E3 ubiquitin-protein ligase UBR7